MTPVSTMEVPLDRDWSPPATDQSAPMTYLKVGLLLGRAIEDLMKK